MPNKQPLPWSRYLPAVLTSCVGIALSLIAFAIVWNWEAKRREYEFNRRTEGIATVLQQKLDQDLEVMRNIGDFFAASGFVERPSFQRFVQRPLSRHPNIQLVAWLPRITDAERQTYEEAAREDPRAPFEISELDPKGKRVSAKQHPQYFPIYYVEPLAGNEKTVGFNLASHPTYLWALEQAKDKIFVTQQTEWIVGSDNQLRLLLIEPVYNKEEAVAETPQPKDANQQTPDPDQTRSNPSLQRQEVQGFILGVFRLADIFELSLEKGSFANFNLYICDETPASVDKRRGSNPENRLLAIYESTQQKMRSKTKDRPAIEVPTRCPVGSLEKHKVKDLLGEDENQDGSKRTLKVGNRQWTLYILPTSEYRESQTKHWRSWATLIIGLLWTHIPVTYLLTSMSRTAQIERLAKERASQAEKLKEAFQQLEAEQIKSERLLLNVLPKEIAERLKHDQTTIADSFGEVTVLFADIVGFTNLAARISASELVKVLNVIFSAFDQLAQLHALEKIKTIGDAYMVVGGLPTHRPDHAEAIAEMALDMQQEIARFDIENGENFSMRIGIHTGPVVAGVIGTNKFIYDLWGDTVNTASRMESHGLAGCIQVTEATYQLLQDKFWFEKRDPMQIKGKGEMTTYLLIGRKLARKTQAPLALPSREISKYHNPSELENEQAIA